jgi:8-oxo-dGTP pyrophosphatase MutT (NUDIX family)
MTESGAPHDTGAPVTTASGDAVGGGPGPVLRDVDQHWPVVGRPRRAKGVFVVLRTDEVRMPDGEVARRDVVEHPGAVAVVALDDAGRVLLIRQYRHPVGHLLWEIPAGLRDVPGEPSRGTAERELREETGYAARTWHVLTDCYTSPGISTERVTVFLARDLAEVPDPERGPPLQHEEAQLQYAWAPLDQAVQLFLAGELHNGVTAVGILAAYAARQGDFAALREAGAGER